MKVPELPDWKIGIKCDVGVVGVEHPTADQKASLSSAVSRHIKVAKALIRGIEEGIFPARATDLAEYGIAAEWVRKLPAPKLKRLRL